MRYPNVSNRFFPLFCSKMETDVLTHIFQQTFAVLMFLTALVSFSAHTLDICCLAVMQLLFSHTRMTRNLSLDGTDWIDVILFTFKHDYRLK